MATTTLISVIALVLSVIINIFLIIRVAVLRNYLHLFETKIGEIEARLSNRNNKGIENEQKTVRTSATH